MKQKKRAKRRREKGLAQMVAASERMGLYDAELRQAAVRSAGAYTVDELIAQLHVLREQLGGHVPVIVGERGTELACAVDVVRWRDLEDAALECVAARICGV